MKTHSQFSRLSLEKLSAFHLIGVSDTAEEVQVMTLAPFWAEESSKIVLFPLYSLIHQRLTEPRNGEMFHMVAHGSMHTYMFGEPSAITTTQGA